MTRRFVAALVLSGAIFMIAGCKDEVSVQSSGPIADTDAWLIPVGEVFDGGPGKDGIPALTNPPMTDISSISYLAENDLLLGFKVGDEVRAYPHPILDWHEIINDSFGGTVFAVTYCPLTGSGIGWNRVINGQATTFGVSGLLYNTNLIPYDRASNSNWSQMKLQCVNGPLVGVPAATLPIVETTWKTWKQMYPESKVVSSQTGISRPYGRYPYGDYKTNNDRLLFPIGNDDSRLSRKERVLGVLAGSKARVYRIGEFSDGIGAVNDVVSGIPVVVAGSKDHNFATAYERMLPGGKVLNFIPVQDALPAVMVDDEGTTWDIFGYGVSGPRTGQQLGATRSFIAFWFAWATFYPEVEIYGR